jgi:hypothetical protein
MRQVRIEEPPVNCQVIGSLYESDDPSELGQDMLEVILENGILIDAGWYPEGDPSGCYVISVRIALTTWLQSLRRTCIIGSIRVGRLARQRSQETR